MTVSVSVICGMGTVGYSGTGGMASGVSVSRSMAQHSGTMETELAAALAPRPHRYPLVERGTCLSAIVLVFAFPVWLAWFITIAVRAAKRNKRVERGADAAWRVWSQGRFCQRCGGVFFPADAATVLPPGIPHGELLQPLVFQRLVWAAGGYEDLQP